MNKEKIISELIAQGMHRIEAECEVARYNRIAQQSFEEANCEDC